MRCIILTILIPLVFLIICACGGSAHAAFIEFDNPALTREERLIRLQVEKHRGNLSVIPNSSIHAIDGREDAIQISQERTSLPESYMALPTSKRDMERYNGR